MSTGPIVGSCVDHHGSGHLHRGLAISRASRLDGWGWTAWNDGRGGQRAGAALGSLVVVPLSRRSA